MIKLRKDQRVRVKPVAKNVTLGTMLHSNISMNRARYAEMDGYIYWFPNEKTDKVRVQLDALRRGDIIEFDAVDLI